MRAKFKVIGLQLYNKQSTIDYFVHIPAFRFYYERCVNKCPPEIDDRTMKKMIKDHMMEKFEKALDRAIDAMNK